MSGKMGVTSLVALGLLGTTAAYAEDLNLDEVVVSAGLTPVDEEKVGRAYSVVTGEELEKGQIKYVADALRSVPGVIVNRTGSYGGLTSIRIRGSETNHVLVLIDDIEATENANGSFDFGGLQVADIERIEVLRGPQSALYGSDAVAGVVHIITKSGRRDGNHASIKTETGTDGTALLDLGMSGGHDRFDYAFSGAFRRTDGFNISDDGSEDDGDRNVTLNGRINADLSDNVKFSGSARYVDRKSEVDDTNYTTGKATDAAGLYSKTKEFYTGAGLTWSLMDDRFVQKLKGEYTNVESDQNAGGLYVAKTERTHLSYQGTLFFDSPNFADAKHSLTGETEWENESFEDSYLNNGTQERNLYGFVAEYQGQYWDKLFLNTAVRYDINDDFKNAFTYSTSAAYQINETNSRLHASVGKGVKNPSFYDQFGSYSSFVGNPDLKPESSIGWDFGIKQAMFDDRFSVDVTYFNQTLTDAIVSCSAGASTSLCNSEGETRKQGIEVAADLAVTDTLHVKASYSYLHTQSGTTIYRAPRHSGSVQVTQSLLDGKAHVFADAVFNGSMTDNVWTLTPSWSYVSSPITLADYAVVNVGADYQINDQVQLYGRVENLLDADYQEVYGYNTAGITGYIGMKADF
nr:TonB-dependent receptor [uncultured Cohaesibacter sp.]